MVSFPVLCPYIPFSRSESRCLHKEREKRETWDGIIITFYVHRGIPAVGTGGVTHLQVSRSLSTSYSVTREPQVLL